ncbi:MAG TPA: hypothetical protein VM238_14535 [Phycisphaerae bacterium]|nr:hypothetical protein [Phycisphaerae bacterium]
MKKETYVIFAVLITVTAAFALTGAGPGEHAAKEQMYPPLSDLMSEKEAIRSRAIGRFVGAQEELVRQLSEVVHPRTGKTLQRERRASACFLLAKMRTNDPHAIDALLAAIDQHFLPTVIYDIPYGVLDPPEALIAIGKPAVEPVLDELAKTAEGGDRLVLLRNVLYGIEGADCALLRTQAHIDKEADPKKKARLEATLEWLEGLKASRQKK